MKIEDQGSNEAKQAVNKYGSKIESGSKMSCEMK